MSDKAKQRRMLYTWFCSSHLRLYILPHSEEENESCSKTVLFTSNRAVLALCQANSVSLTFSQCLTCGHLLQPFRGLTVISTSGLQDFSALECSVCLLQTIKPPHWTMKLSVFIAGTQARLLVDIKRLFVFRTLSVSGFLAPYVLNVCCSWT